MSPQARDNLENQENQENLETVSSCPIQPEGWFATIWSTTGPTELPRRRLSSPEPSHKSRELDSYKTGSRESDVCLAKEKNWVVCKRRPTCCKHWLLDVEFKLIVWTESEQFIRYWLIKSVSTVFSIGGHPDIWLLGCFVNIARLVQRLVPWWIL